MIGETSDNSLSTSAHLSNSEPECAMVHSVMGRERDHARVMGKSVWKKLIEILDGAPAVNVSQTGEQGQRRPRGQTLVEMTLLTPLLLILFAGLVEIGWLANTYLNLLDITRMGARYATTLQDDRSPLEWDNRSSPVPNDNIALSYEMPYTVGQEATEADLRLRVRETWPLPIQGGPPDPPVARASFSGCSNDEFGFYDDIICRMLISLPNMRNRLPTRLDPYNHVDDIIISAFSLELVEADYTDPAARPIVADVPQLLVVGRYPTNVNECHLDADFNLDVIAFDLRDPFDLNRSASVDTRDSELATSNPALYDFNPHFSEVAGYDAAPTDTASAERQVGFQWYGNHEIPNTGCIGSEWDIERVEQILNLPNYNLTDPAERRMIPSQGLVLVEVYWEHEMLLEIPVLSPVFEAFERDGKPDLYLWAMFPLPTTDPFIEFVD